MELAISTLVILLFHVYGITDSTYPNVILFFTVHISQKRIYASEISITHSGRGRQEVTEVDPARRTEGMI